MLAPMDNDKHSHTNTGDDISALLSDGLLRIKEAAAFLRVSHSKLYELIAARELAVVTIPPKVGATGRGDQRIPKGALIAFARKHLTPRS